ncbi:MAG TPA: TonB-dependent receptor plug domain-containing protein, partial [Lysobacter sp.]
MNMHDKCDPAMRRRPLVKAITRSLAATLAVALAGPALAQQSATQAPADDTAAAQAITTLDNMVVTANKREENIREVAAAITVLGGEQLENFGATQMTDYASYVPGLQIQSSGTPGQTQVSMRGIAAMSPGSTVGTYIDETPIGSNSLYQQATLFSLDLFPYDIARIEVLRGPQGTLYGRNTTGGAINVTSNRPTFSPSAEVSAEYGRYNSVLANTAVSGPIVADKLAVRVAAQYLRDDGNTVNEVTVHRVNDTDRGALRISLLYTPDADNEASLSLTRYANRGGARQAKSRPLFPSTPEATGADGLCA